MLYLAHSANRAGREESVYEHLSCVAGTASNFARAFDAGAEARAAGLLHDLGKFGMRFQERLKNPTQVRGVDHWSFGAEFAWLQYGSHKPALPAALDCTIRGHHIGLKCAEGNPQQRRLQAIERLEQLAVDLGEADARAVIDRFAATQLLLPRLKESVYQAANPAAVAGMLDVRMLFSTLVDADYLETEAHFNGTAASPRVYRDPPPLLDPERALAAVLTRMDIVRRESDATPDITEIRESLLANCLATANGRRGLYTLTAPTGAGKTLAMLAFALQHAVTHSVGDQPLRRIVAVIPFLTIIEQTAGIYRRIFDSVFGDEYVIEDHSQAGSMVRGHLENPQACTSDHDGTCARDRQRLLAENWDAPLIVTTSVQMLESMFANRPRACRKLHRLANSILLFDEVQTLPPRLAVATLAAVSRLVERYGCTAVFSTATQPAFEHLHPEVQRQCAPGWKPAEIVHDTSRMFAVSARRTRVEWRLDRPTSWESLADELATQDQVLCVVNLKRHALGLVNLLEQEHGEGLLHLSTNLCPAHREVVLAEVRRRLKDGQPCCLIATQCIEAGVDVDFPSAYRALGPLEAITQVAGRCNRGGKSRTPGSVVVFLPHLGDYERTLYPPGYEDASLHARDFVRQWKREHGDTSALIHDPDAIAECFRQFYDFSGKTRLPSGMVAALQARDFERIAAEYRLIDGDTVRVLVPYEVETYRELRRQADPHLPFERARQWFARAAFLAVNIYRPGQDADTSALIPVQVGSREQGQDETEWFVLADEELYDSKRLGLRSIGDRWVV